MHLGESEEAQLASKLPFYFGAFIGADVVPLVHRYHQGPSGVENVTRDVRVLLRYLGLRIEQEDDHVGIFDRLQRLDH